MDIKYDVTVPATKRRGKIMGKCMDSIERVLSGEVKNAAIQFENDKEYKSVYVSLRIYVSRHKMNVRIVSRGNTVYILPKNAD